MLTYLGSLTVALAIPLLGTLQLTLKPIFDELAAKLAAMVKLSAAIVVTVPAITAELMFAAAGRLLATPPAVGANVSFAAAVVVKIKLQIEAILEITKWNGTAGVHMFVYDGPMSGLSTSLASAGAQAGVAPGSPVYVTILLANADATKVALKAVFKTP